MKKIHIIILLFFISFLKLYSQEICGEIKYTFKTDIAYEYIEQYSMKFNNTSSLFQEIDVKQIENKQKTIESNDGETKASFAKRKNINSKYFYNIKNAFYFKDIFEDVELIVKEDKFVWDWKLKSETKAIGNFKCQKATITYRGRNYIAWFTNEIPVPFGPWKFQGLSGIILEVYDTDKKIHIVANKIKINTEDCSINIDKSSFKEALNIKEYLSRKEELINEVFAKMASKMPKGFTMPKYDKNCEDCKGIEIFDEEN
jgi:GLPGLI family protein